MRNDQREKMKKIIALVIAGGMILSAVAGMFAVFM